MGCDCQPEGPLIEISPAENGFIITAYNAVADPKGGTLDVFAKAFGHMTADDPMAAFKKAVDQANLKDSVRRKEVEHHVAKTAEEALRILSEILSTMKP